MDHVVVCKCTEQHNGNPTAGHHGGHRTDGRPSNASKQPILQWYHTPERIKSRKEHSPVLWVGQWIIIPSPATSFRVVGGGMDSHDEDQLITLWMVKALYQLQLYQTI